MDYYYSDGQNKYGPFSINDLCKKINLNTLVWREGMSNWEPASNIDELKKELSVSTPPPIIYQKKSEYKHDGLLILSIIGLLASLWFLTGGTYAFLTNTYIYEATPIQILVSLYSLAFSIVAIVKSRKSK